MKARKKFQCPLCESQLSKARYYEIIGVWEERVRLEKTLKEQIQNLEKEKQKWLLDKKMLKTQMEKEKRQATKEAFEHGKKKEKARAERLSKMIQARTQELQNANKKIKELQEQLKKGTTPQVEGFNLEEELVKELKREFPDDRIEHHGKTGDILHQVFLKSKPIGKILYECKKTAKFNSIFIDQTKKAMLVRQAKYGVLVTTAFKKDTSGFWIEKDILIVHPFGAVYIAHVLRKSIIEIYSAQMDQRETERRSKELMIYIRSEDFKSAVEDSIYRTRNLYDLLLKERDGHLKLWRTRYDHYKTIYNNVNRVDACTSNIIVKGLSAKEALKHLILKQLPPPESRG